MAEQNFSVIRRVFGRRLGRQITTVLISFGLLMSALPGWARAAEGEIRIVEQFGIVYLLLNVVRDQQLIEKHGKAEGLEIKVDWQKLSGGAAVNDALLSGSVDIAGAGIGPLFTVWDRTKGKQNVKGVASLGNFPYYLVSNNPKVKTIADFTAQDRIALPAVGVSIQSRFLHYASAKLWGDAQYNRLDPYTVAVPHPEAAAALISGGTELNAHFANPPFQEEELKGNPNAHVVLDTYELLGPNSPTVLYSTEKFRTESPKTYRAFLAALDEAARFARNNKAAAAEIFVRVNGSRLSQETVQKLIENPQYQFTLTPTNTYKIADFLHRVGVLKNKPESWQDYFFVDPLLGEGS
jgi:NitT/TauT family transport system substrate-binding protein